MARKARDYKAEYAARKQRATKAGYGSVRKYTAARKTFQVPRNASPIPRTVAEREVRSLRREARAWSRDHSHSPLSRYSPTMSDRQVVEYHRAFIQESDKRTKSERQIDRLAWLHDWLVPDFMDEDEWISQYLAEN